MKIFKSITSIGTSLSLLYWAAIPVLAVGGDPSTNGISLCPTNFSGSNTLCAAASIGGIVQTIINVVLFVAFIAALIFLIYGGIRWIISGGDKEGTAKARGTVTSALIGLVVVLGAWILINLILQFFGIQGGLSGLQPPALIRQ